MTLPALFNIDEHWRAAQRYQPFFCEENVWQLLRGEALPQPAVALFVGNTERSVAMWGQRAVRSDPVFWDYHVVALLLRHGCVIDLDDRECVARPVRAWLAHAFRAATVASLQPCFRIVPAAEFLARFSSDRSHMRDDTGRPSQPFPAWPAPFQPRLGMNLMRFVDFADPFVGTVTDAAGLMTLTA